jgi:hypothetical protein
MLAFLLVINKLKVQLWVAAMDPKLLPKMQLAETAFNWKKD